MPRPAFFVCRRSETIPYHCSMAHPLTAKRLPPRSAAYIAGLVDGEGTIALTALHRGENRRLVTENIHQRQNARGYGSKPNLF